MVKEDRQGLSYDIVGDNYGQKDPLKVIAQVAAATTSQNLELYGYKEIKKSRGESAYVIDVGDFYLATTPEGLGTKNLIADAIYRLNSQRTYYYEIGIDTVASIVNDLITVGAQPLVVSPHWGLGSNNWLDDNKRFRDLVDGWTEGCNRAGAAYGGGETPTLRGIVYSDKVELSGSAVGIIAPKGRLTLGDKLKSGDHIIFIESNGLHTNGASLVRHIAEDILPNGYNTPLPNGRTFGEALLSPSHIYAKLQRELFENCVDIHSMIHMTGHGLRKVMRAEREFTYRIKVLPLVPDEFSLIQEAGGYSDRSMYEVFNMGAGFAFFVSESDVERTQLIASSLGYKSWDAGVVEEGPKQVIIEPKNIIYSAESLQIR